MTTRTSSGAGGTNSFDLTTGDSTSQTFSWIVAPRLAVYNPGGQASTDGNKLALQVSAVANPGDALTWSLGSGSPSWLSINSTGLITGTVPSNADSSTPYTVTVIVDDVTDESLSTSLSFTWTINKPTVSLLVPANQVSSAGSTVNLLALAAASNGDAVTYSATGLSALGLVGINASTGVISGTISPAVASLTPYTITITATDTTTSVTTSQTFTWMVNPTLTLTDPGTQTTSPDAYFTLPLSAQSTVGGTITYGATGLPDGYAITTSTGVIDGTASSGDVAHGPYLVTITATQGSVTVTQVFNWTVTPITLQNPGSQFNRDGDPVLLSLAASDTDGGSLIYSAVNLPAGLTVDSAGLIQGTIAATADTNSPYKVEVKAIDGSATFTQTFIWAVAPAPKISIIDAGNQRNFTGDFVITPITAIDPFGGTVSYSAAGLPSGLAINPTTGLIVGTIASGAASPTPYSVTITAVDGSHSSTDTFTWTVTAAPTLVFANPGPQTSPVGLPVSFTFQANTTATWSGSGLPAGLTLSSGGVLSGAPTTAGNYLVKITATSGSVSMSRTFVWQVTAAGVAFPGNQISAEGEFVSVQLQGTGGSGITYNAVGLPTGLTLNSQTGLIDGTLGVATAGIYVVDVSATIGTSVGSQTFTWIVNPAIRLTAISNQIGVEGQAVSIPVQAFESDASLSYQAWGLPTGVTINTSTGLISGTLASGTALRGGYTVAVQVSDGTNKNAVSFAWLVNPATTPSAPVEGKVPNETSVAGQSVNLNLNTFDPAGYAYIEAVNNLPDGLALSPITGAIQGVIADDAVSPVPYNVSVVLNDGLGNTKTERFLWSVQPTNLTAQVYPISATMGASTGQVAIGSFTTPDLNSLPGDFIVTINWGDGKTSSGTAQGGLGSFTILASHNFAAAGLLPVSIDILDIYVAMKETLVYGTANVTDASMTVTGGFQLGALANQETSLTLAYFTIASRNVKYSNLMATINWGDGSAPQDVNIAPAVNGLYQVTGLHSYSSDGLKTVTIEISDGQGNVQATTSMVEVGDLYAGVNGKLTLGSFTGPPGATYTVSINWGDSTTSTPDMGYGTATNVGGVVTVTAYHTFDVDSIDSDNSVYQVQVTITGGGGTLGTTVPVEVTRPPAFLVVANVAAMAGTSFTNSVVAMLVEPNIADPRTEFSASINWGDGSNSSGTIEEIGTNPGLFQIVASHTYSATATGALLVNVSQEWGESVPSGAAASKIYTGGPGGQKAQGANYLVTREEVLALAKEFFAKANEAITVRKEFWQWMHPNDKDFQFDLAGFQKNIPKLLKSATEQIKNAPDSKLADLKAFYIDQIAHEQERLDEYQHMKLFEVQNKAVQKLGRPAMVMVPYKDYLQITKNALENGAFSNSWQAMMDLQEHPPFRETDYKNVLEHIKKVAKGSEQLNLALFSPEFVQTRLNQEAVLDNLGVHEKLGSSEMQLLQRILKQTALPVGIPTGGKTFRPTAHGTTRVQVANVASIINNLASRDLPWRPESGLGGVAWFVRQGDTVDVGVLTGPRVEINVALTNWNPTLLIHSDELLRIRDSIVTRFVQEQTQAHTASTGTAPTNSQIRRWRSSATHFANGHVWEVVGERVRTGASNGMAEIIFENSPFSRNRVTGQFQNGRYLLVSETARASITLNTSVEAIGQSLGQLGQPVTSAQLESARLQASRLNRAARVRYGFHIGGRVLFVVAIGNTAYEIWESDFSPRVIASQAGGWAGAIGAGSAFATWAMPVNTAGPWAWAAYGVGTIVASGIGASFGARFSETVYDWAFRR